MSGGDRSIVPEANARPAGRLALLSPSGIQPVDPAPAEHLIDGFLRLASHILVRAHHKPLSTIGITSANRGEGKTTAALNLAICLGRIRGGPGRVLLVDGDTRGRALTRLVGNLGADDVAHEATLVVSPFPGVDLMTAPSPVTSSVWPINISVS